MYGIEWELIGTVKPTATWAPNGTDLNCCFGIARIFAKGRRYPTLNLSTSPSSQPGSLWSVVIDDVRQ